MAIVIPQWQFPENEVGEPEGPNDGGISHFTGKRNASVIRESIQNSLDARSNTNKPVLVSLRLIELPLESFDALGLQRHLNAAVKSPHNDEPHSAQFARGSKKLAKGRVISTLVIADSNTSGATDEPRENGSPSKWEALTKGTGFSAKDTPDAAGSFGLGKYAPFAVTDLRTVLYSTSWQAGDGSLVSRFQGKAILVSHEDADRRLRRKTGYLGGEKYRPLADDAILPIYQRNTPGLSIYLPGYQPERNWLEESIATVITHFFHAIVQDGLEVQIEQELINQSSLAQHLGQVSSPKTHHFIGASKTPPIAETVIENIGAVQLRIVPDESGRHRNIALVRDAGMMITDNPRDMGLPGFKRIPGGWKGFTAIISCLSEGKKSVLRDSESARHDQISTDQITDPQRRKQADAILRRLGEWCKSEIGKIVGPKEQPETQNISELTEYLSIQSKPDEASAPPMANTAGQQLFLVSQPSQSHRPPPSRRMTGKTRTTAAVAGGSGSQRSRDGQRGGVKNPQRKRQQNASDVESLRSGIRFQPGNRKPTHSVRATFDTPADTIRNIQLVALGEDGAEVQMGLQQAFVNGKSRPVKNHKLSSAPPGNSSRMTIEFITTEPVANKTFQLVIGEE